MHEARLVMMAGDETPELPADDDRDDECRRDAHVLEVLHVDRRHAAQEAQRHVEIPPGDRRLPRRQRHGLVLHVGEHADAVALVQPPRDLRDVGCRIAIAEIGLEVRLAPFGEDLAVALVVETIDHHTVVAGQSLKIRAVSSHSARSDDASRTRLHRPCHVDRQVDRGAGAFELDHDAALGRAVQQNVELLALARPGSAPREGFLSADR